MGQLRKALVVGIDDYAHMKGLSASVSDARAVSKLLAKNEDGSPNFTVDLLTELDAEEVTRGALRRHCRELFDDFQGDVLFYFSGHGVPTDIGGYLVTADGYDDEPGLPMSELVMMANKSKAQTVLIVLDCCHAGMAGNAPGRPTGDLEMGELLREGVTILSAARPGGVAVEKALHGVFTDLLIGALRGGAANLRGHVSAPSIYAYIEAALGAVRSRPMYKSHASSLDPVRICSPQMPDALLRELPTFFPTPSDTFALDPSYESTRPEAVPERVAIFDKFKKYQVAGLLVPIGERDLYWAADKSGSVQLTELGKFYCRLASEGRF